MPFVLDENKNIIEADLLTYSAFMHDFKNRIVKKTFFGNVEVSTVFLTIPHGINLNEFFETMVFGGIYDGEQIRYETYEDALSGHEKIVLKIKKELN